MEMDSPLEATDSSRESGEINSVMGKHGVARPAGLMVHMVSRVGEGARLIEGSIPIFFRSRSI